MSAHREPKPIPAHIELNGHSVKNILAGMALIQTRALKLLATHGITEVKPEGWYSLQQVIKILYAIQEQIGPNTIRAIGRKVPENSVFPPELKDLEQVLSSLDTAYRMNHRGSGYIGGYRHEPTGPKSCRIVADNPYPCEFDKGLLEALGERFRPQDSLWVRVEHDAKVCRAKGDAACTYTLIW